MSADGDLVEAVETVARSGRLSVAANLSVTIDGVDVAVGSIDDRRLRILIDSVSDAVRIARSQADRLAAVSTVLREAGVTAEVHVGSAVVAVVGADATPGVLSRLLSLETVELRPRAAAAAVVRIR